MSWTLETCKVALTHSHRPNSYVWGWRDGGLVVASCSSRHQTSRS